MPGEGQRCPSPEFTEKNLSHNKMCGRAGINITDDHIINIFGKLKLHNCSLTHPGLLGTTSPTHMDEVKYNAL